MKNSESNDINSIIEQVRKSYTDVREFINVDFWGNWFKGDKRKPVCGIQLINYLCLSPIKSKKALREKAAEVADYLSKTLNLRKDAKLLAILKPALSDIFVEWWQSKIIIMYNSSTMLQKYLYILILDRIKTKPDEINNSYEIFEKPIEEVPQSKIKKPYITLFDEDEDTIIDRIDWRRKVESLDDKSRSVLEKYYEGYSEREILEITKIPKTTIHEIISRYK